YLAPRKGGDFRLEIPGVRHLAMPMMCGEEGIDASGATPSETLKPPVFIDGIISKRGKVDVYKIELKGGEKISAEIFARRYDSPLDAYISISDAKGKILASGDDHEDLSCGLTTHHADPLVEFTPKSTGVYYLRVGDSSGGASEAHAYRLRVSAPVPDFSVCAAPTALNMRNGGAVAVKLKAFKKGGFDAPIRVFMKDLSKGWSQFGGVIPAGSDTGELVIKSPPNFKRRVSVLHAAAVSSIDGKKTYRRVSPCEDMMQAFYYRHYVPFPRFYACAGNNGSFIRPFDRMAFLPIKKPVLVVEGKPRELRLANFQSKAIWQLVPSIAESCKLSAEKFFAESGGVYVKLVPKEGAKIGDSGVFNLSVNIKNRRKIYSLDIVPNIAYKIVSQAEFDADLAAEKKAEAAAKAAKAEADKKAAIAKAAREREAAQKAAAAKAAAEKKAADKAKKDAKKKQKDAAKKQPEKKQPDKKQHRDGADEKK
ncbi:MAG: PPC domain-containing protein, partial [Opitutales bacterium]|nr:PPC domain-containing protein [Opitutales bacterium]